MGMQRRALLEGIVGVVLGLGGCADADSSDDEPSASDESGGSSIEREPENSDSGEPGECPGQPAPMGYLGASGERESCGMPDAGASKIDVPECDDRKLSDTGLEYCVRAHPDCESPGAGCFAVITFNMGPKGLSQTIGNRTREPHLYGKFVAVGGGTSADLEQMIELPQALRKEFPGIDPQTIYVLGNSAGNGAIKSLLQSAEAASQYAAAAVIAGGIKVPDDYVPQSNLHVIFINGKDDIADPGGLREIAAKNGCEDADGAQWHNVSSADPYVTGGDCTDIAERITFGACATGDVVGYRFKDEGHDAAGYDQHFEPRVRPMRMAFDFFMGRSLDDGLSGTGSACWK